MKQSVWRGSLAIWAVLSLSFMAAMGIGSGIFVAASLWALAGRRDIWKMAGRHPLAWASLFFFAACLASVIASKVNPPLGMQAAAFKDLQKFHYFLLPFLGAAAWLFTCGGMAFERHIAWKYYMGMAFFVSAVGILQFWGSYIFPQAWLETSFFRVVPTGNLVNVYHAQGLMKFHLSFASAMGFVCSCSWARLLWPMPYDTRTERWAWRLLCVLSSFALFFTFSRISWVALGAIVIALFFLKKPRWGLCSVAAIALAFVCVWKVSPDMRGRWNLGLQTIAERQHVWLAGREMITDRPLTGVGFGKTGFYSSLYSERALGEKPAFSSHAHNNFLDMAAATGIFGLAGFALWWGVLFTCAWRAFRAAPEAERWLPAACLAGFLAFHVNGLTQVNFFDAKSQHSLMFWAGIALALDWRRRKRGLEA